MNDNLGQISIALVAGLPDKPGGTEKSIVRLAQALRKCNVLSTIFTPDPGPPFQEQVPVTRCTHPLLPNSLMLAYSLWKARHTFDLIQVQLISRIPALVKLIGILVNKPVILEVKNSDTRQVIQQLKLNTGTLGHVDRWLWQIIKKIDYFIVVNEEIMEILINESIVHERIALIRNGVPLFSEIEVRSNPLDPARILHVGFFKRKKRQDILVKALARLNDSAHVVFAGDGPQFPSIMALAEELRVADLITFPGYVHNAAEALMPKADIFVLCSDQEGMPNVLLEAMSHGLPCVATAIPGVLPLIEHEKTGLMIPKDDPQALADSIERLINDENLRRKLGENARKLIQTQYTMDTVAREHREAYKILLTDVTH